jgi:hypothetical protein
MRSSVRLYYQCHPSPSEVPRAGQSRAGRGPLPVGLTVTRGDVTHLDRADRAHRREAGHSGQAARDALRVNFTRGPMASSDAWIRH